MNSEHQSAGDIAAARILKLVYYVDNVDMSVSADDLVRFMATIGVRCISCFKVTKPRMTRWQRENNVVVDHKAYRVCINRADVDKFMDASKWGDGITIDRWISLKYRETNDTVQDSAASVGRSSSKPRSESTPDATATSAATMSAATSIVATDNAKNLRLSVVPTSNYYEPLTDLMNEDNDNDDEDHNTTVIEVDLDETVRDDRPNDQLLTSPHLATNFNTDHGGSNSD